MLDDLWTRLQRFVTASGKKAAVLAVLFLFGCSIWISIFSRVLTAGPITSRSSDVAIAGGASSAENGTNSIANQSLIPDEFWGKLAVTLANDPLYQAAPVQSIRRNPFQHVKSLEQAALPIVNESVVAAPVEKKREDIPRLELRSTVIGHSRRAAMINGRLYQLGRTIETDGRQYLLTKVEPHRVELLSGGQTIELTLARPPLVNSLNLNEPPVPTVQ